MSCDCDLTFSFSIFLSFYFSPSFYNDLFPFLDAFINSINVTVIIFITNIIIIVLMNDHFRSMTVILFTFSSGVVRSRSEKRYDF